MQSIKEGERKEWKSKIIEKRERKWTNKMCWDVVVGVTRLGDLLHFGQLFKAHGNNYFAQSVNTF